MKLQTITTIELSNVCNLECKYCINRMLIKHDSREPGIMSNEVFHKSLQLVEKLVAQGTQKEINLNGNGEACLDPDIIDRVRLTKIAMNHGHVQMSTNAVNLTYSMVKGLADAGLDRLDVSPHSPYHVRRAMIWIADIGINSGVNAGPLLKSHNWAGQLEPEHSIDCRIEIGCSPLVEGRGYIQKEGNISPCCYDYRNLGTFGNVFDKDIFEKEIRPYSLCESCHQVIPNGLFPDYQKGPVVYQVNGGVARAVEI